MGNPLLPTSKNTAFVVICVKNSILLTRKTNLQSYGPLAAAVLNGAFIQATELDDYHSVAPLHSNSVLLPTLFAAAEAQKHRSRHSPITVSGLCFLVALIVGFETGPRVGNALYGSDMLSQGWHSGPIFGSPASAAAASKLFNLDRPDIESALGIACTQAGGLMSAQYEGMIKRVQHAFAARNGLFGALLARTGYVGIKKVFERTYGGFLAMFSQGSDKTPRFKVQEITKDLGDTWHTQNIRVKLHACVGGCHGQIECLENMQRQYPDCFAAQNIKNIKKITVYLSAPIFAHDGWAPTERPLTSTGAQMNAAYIGAVQIIDRQVLLQQFADHSLDRDDIWEIVHKTTCLHSEEFDIPNHICGARIIIEFADGRVLEDVVAMPKGYDPPIQNKEILKKWRRLARSVIDEERVLQIENCVLNLENLDDVSKMIALVARPVGKVSNPLEKGKI